MRQRLILLLTTLAFSTAAFAQSQAAQPLAATSIHEDFTLEQEIVAGGLFGRDNDSPVKAHEYGDLGEGFRLFKLRLLGYSQPRAIAWEVFGSNLGGDDQAVDLRVARPGYWSAELGFDALPHRLTNDALSPYRYQGNGVFTVPSVVGILTATPTGNTFLASDMLENDRRIAAYLDQNLNPLSELGTQNDTLSFQASYLPVPHFEARLTAARETREGEKITYGPLGDRPPRTINIELPEPIDYDETTFMVDLAWANRAFDATLEIYAPTFENNIDTMRWQSIYFGPSSAGLDYNKDVILAGDAIARRAVSVFGQRSLFPDNDATQATLSLGFDAPLDGRFTATAAAGRLRQDETLLPYSYSSLAADWDSTEKLPRLTAEAAIDTLLIDLQYVMTPVRGLRVRPFLRSYQLDNDTPADQWHYVTQDTASSTTGGTTYKNQRVNLAYGFDRQNYGVETTWQGRRGSSLGLRLENESVDRDFREADTDELIIRATGRFRPLPRLTIRGGYTFGDREADGYNTGVTSQTYWYTQEQAGTNQDNPRFAFTNHPDMRRYDVSDRRRDEYELRATYAASDALAISASFSAREKDFDSNVTPVQPLAGTTFAAANGITPGIQLGLLAQDFTRTSLDASWTPSDRWATHAFVSVDALDLVQRSMAYNENSRISAQTPLLATAGQAWTDTRSIWRAAHDDSTTTFGGGFNYSFIPDRLTIAADVAHSKGTLDIAYSGYGNDMPLTTTYYAWRSPETSEYIQTNAEIGLEYRLQRGFILGLNLLFDDYETQDWMFEPTGDWVDVVNDNFLRDSTLDNRWGNRMPRMVGYLSPSYTESVGFVTIGYRW
ncbi:MAG: MtrB/PioB family outer membrane beta-barrel protein [Thermoanaerobaculia bacterium]